MPALDWWLLHAAQTAALVAVLTLSLLAAWRIGAHTLYGNLLFLLGMGFWSLLLGEFLFSGRQALGTWDGPPGFNDVLNVMGWSLVMASIVLFVYRFTPARRSGRLARATRLGLYMLAPLAIMLALFRMWLSPPGADELVRLRGTYLALDGLTMGAIAAGLQSFARLRHGALGRLYLFLGAALLVKTAGDAYWAYLAARGLDSLVATALYPLSGVVAVWGLALHLRHMRRESLAPETTSPWLRPEQRYLGELAMRLQETAGGYAARTALAAAGRRLEQEGVAWRIDGFTLEAEAPSAAWRAAVPNAERVAEQLLGPAGHHVLAALRAARTRFWGAVM